MDATSAMTGATRYQLAPRIRVAFTPGGATLLDTSNGRIVTTNASAAGLLRLLQTTSDYDSLYQILARCDDAPASETMHQQLQDFLEGLITAGLVDQVRS